MLLLRGWEKPVRLLGAAGDGGTKDGHLWPSYNEAWSEHPGCLGLSEEASVLKVAVAILIHHCPCPPGGG